MLEYARKLEQPDFIPQQAEVQADAMRVQGDAQAAALRDFANELEDKARRELATKGDVQDVRLEIERVRAEIQKVKFDLLKWQIGGWVAMAALMAKGFGWRGF